MKHNSLTLRPEPFIHCPVTLGYADLGCETLSSGRTYTTPSGKKYPSITTVLSAHNRGDLQEWRARVGDAEANAIGRRAASRGTSLHSLCEMYLANDPDLISKQVMPDAGTMFKSIQRHVLDSHIGTIFLQEKPLYSDHLRIAGRCDLIAEFDGRPSVIDFKSSSRVKKAEDIPTYFCQTAAYCIMFEEQTGIPIDQGIIIMGVDGMSKPSIFVQPRDKWVPMLLSLIEAHRKDSVFSR